jgi:hypothetical protein
LRFRFLRFIFLWSLLMIGFQAFRLLFITIFLLWHH